jgi:hypothetical protein
MLTRPLNALLSTVAAICTLVLIPPSADAAQPNSNVMVHGRVTCYHVPLQLPGPVYVVVRVRMKATNGEAHDAQVLGVTPFHFYSVTFTMAPADGESVTAYISCGNSEDWGTTFQPTAQRRADDGPGSAITRTGDLSSVIVSRTGHHQMSSPVIGWMARWIGSSRSGPATRHGPRSARGCCWMTWSSADDWP